MSIRFSALLASMFMTVTVFAQSKPTLEQQLQNEGTAVLTKAARAKGDPVRGAVLFYQQQLSCTKCHTAGEAEGRSPLGPDLARPDTGFTAESIVESLLNPSKVIRKGFESVVINRTDGSRVTGLLAEETAKNVVLRDATAPDKLVTIAKDDIESRTISAQSLMPAGLANQIADRQQFLDLIAYLLESAEFGPARARSLRPDAAVINPPLPAYEANLDHAGLITGLDTAALSRGEKLYARMCASCHGTKEQPGSMPTSLKFAEGKFRDGSDPLSLYRTLTRGYGMMAAQTGLVPRQKYDVIHYIRETYLKPQNATQYVTADADYLAKLPKGTSRGPTPPEGDAWLRMDYGPSLTGTFEIGKGGKNIAYKGIAVRLDAGPGGIAKGKAWSVFEHDTLRLAAGWTGSRFIDWKGINFNGEHGIHPHIAGKVGIETAAGPGWANPDSGTFDDPRTKGRDGKPYGPLPRTWGHYRGRYDTGDRTVVSYTVGTASILESPGLAGSDADPVFTRAFEIGSRDQAMTLRVLRHPEGKAVAKVQLQTGTTTRVALTGGDAKTPIPFAGVVDEPAGSTWDTAADGHLLLRIPAGKETLRFTVWAGALPNGAVFDEHCAVIAKACTALDLTSLIKTGKPRWSQTLTTKLERGSNEGPFAVDTFALPVKNPWAAQLRLTGFDFLGGGELVTCTWDGDVWRVSGLDRADGVLTWRRIACGLFQPLGLKVAGGAIYVGCRDQIVILRDSNNDGETDFYENFNSDHEVTEHFHEFAMGLQTDAAGNFVYAKGAPHAKKAVVSQHGTLLQVSKDGTKTDILATGFRAPNGVCVNADGTYFVTDQEGFWMPKNRINWIRPNGSQPRFYGNFWGYTSVIDPSDAAQEEPLCWITNRFDRSPAELIHVESHSWGGMNGALLNISYGAGKVYVVPHEKAGDTMQGGMVALPLPPFSTGVMRGRFNAADGNLYLCGMYAWAGNQQAPGGLYRIHATGRPAHLPVGYHVTPSGLAVTFSDPLAVNVADDPKGFGLKVWDLQRSEKYGSQHLNERALTVKRATLSADHRTVTLTIPDLRPTRGLELWYSVRGADGREVDGLLHCSVNVLPTSPR
ncbi:c-type cytochrome [soil metagenome]